MSRWSGRPSWARGLRHHPRLPTAGLAILAAVALVVVVAAIRTSEEDDPSTVGATSATSRPPLTADRPSAPSTRADRAPRTVTGPSQVRLTFDGASVPLGAPVGAVDNAGRAKVTAGILSASGGTAVSIRGRTGVRALRFPQFQPGESAPRRAVLRVQNTTTIDELSPGTRPFSFGASVRLFRRHQGRLLVDNGSNLIQRGLYGDRGQYKIELDDRLATCRVKGTAGAVAVSTSAYLNARDWYRIGCARQGRMLTIRVVQYARRVVGPPRPVVTLETAFGAIGAVRTASAATPLSVGGKFYPDGSLDTTATDQLNGAVDDVFVRIER